MLVAPKMWPGWTLLTLKFCKGLFIGWISKDPLSVPGVSGQVLFAKQEKEYSLARMQGWSNSILVAKFFCNHCQGSKRLTQETELNS